jgi:hypothetical protein
VSVPDLGYCMRTRILDRAPDVQDGSIACCSQSVFMHVMMSLDLPSNAWELTHWKGFLAVTEKRGMNE